MADEKGIGNQAKDMAKDKVKNVVKEGAKHVIKVIAPYLLVAVVVFVLLAWVIELLDKFKFENLFGWLLPSETTLKVGTGIYQIEYWGGDYEYKLDIDDVWNETDFYDKITRAHFDTAKFPNSSDEELEKNKILYKLILQGLDISEYESEEELLCLPLFIKATTAAAYPDLGWTNGDFKGKVEVWRIQEDGTFKKLKYVDLEIDKPLVKSFKTQVAADKNKALELFTLDNEGNIYVGSPYTTINDFSYSWFNDAANIAKTETTSSTDEGITATSLPYSSVIGQYAVSFEFLQALLIKTKDVDFCTEIANKIMNDTKIVLKIYDNKKTFITNTKESISGDMNCQYLYETHLVYKDNLDNEFSEDWIYEPTKVTPKIERYSYDKNYKKTTTTSYPKLILGEASSIFFNFTQDCSVANSNDTQGPFYNYGTESTRSNDFISEGKIWDYSNEIKNDAINTYENLYLDGDGNKTRTVTNIDFGEAGWGPGSSLWGKIIRTFLTEKVDTETTTQSTSTTYTENTPNIEFKLTSGFYETFTNPQYKDAKSFIYETDESLFQLLESSSKSSGFVPILKYIMFKESGTDYGIKDAEINDILNQLKNNSTFNPIMSLGFEITNSGYFITNVDELKIVLAGYPELVNQAQYLLDLQNMYGINAVAVASASILQTEGGNTATNNNIFGIKLEDGTLKTYTSIEDSIENFFELIKEQKEIINKNNTESIINVIFANNDATEQDKINWKQQQGAEIIDLYEKQEQVKIPDNINAGEEGNGNFDSGYPDTYTSAKSGRTFKNWKQNLGPYQDKAAWDKTVKKLGCGMTSVAIIASGWGSDYTPGSFSQYNFGITNGISSASNSQLSVQMVGSYYPYIQLPETEKQKIINHLASGKVAIIFCAKDLGSEFATWQHFMAILDINGDLNKVYLSNPYNGSETGWVSIDRLFKGASAIYYIKEN